MDASINPMTIEIPAPKPIVTERTSEEDCSDAGASA